MRAQVRAIERCFPITCTVVIKKTQTMGAAAIEVEGTAHPFLMVVMLLQFEIATTNTLFRKRSSLLVSESQTIGTRKKKKGHVT